MTAPAVGERAPDFEVQDQAGEPVTLADLRGRPALIYFYPKDETPGCTQQACDVRDRWEEFTAAGVQVLGVSPDSVESHASFAGNHDLPHTLLSDPDHEMLEAYGAWGEKNLYGRTTVGVIRSAVLLDQDGIVVKRWKRIGAKASAERALAAIEEHLA